MRDPNYVDDIDIFDFSKRLEPVYLPGGQTEGHVLPDDSGIVPEIEEREVKKQEYAEEYREREKEQLRRGQYEEERLKTLYGHGSSLADIEITSAGTLRDVNELKTEEFTDVYKEYYKRRPKNTQNLTISDYRKNILSSIQSNEVIIIKGPTGCGKTTQVPQYILDSFAEKNQHCNIVVTQPRRIAAISIAERVCKERDWPVGTLCGYQVGQKEKISEDTRLTYMTVGVFLNQIVNSKDLTRYTHIILDEIHERNLETDFALLVVKKLLNTNSRHVKIILMSATVDSAKFSTYFQKVYAGKFIMAPVLSVNQPRKFAIQVHYLHELSSLGELPDVKFEEPCISEQAFNICVKLIKQFEKIDSDPKSKKSVLVFLPGINEIEELHKMLTDPKIHSPSESLRYSWLPLPLHSTITHQEQAEAFKPPPTGFRKVILATNIAESSITVPDIKFVIDFCLTKVLVTDAVSNFTSLQLSWTSKANCTQRAGRVGRVMEGRVYRMVDKHFYDHYLEEESLPDMLRCPLEKVVLQSKVLSMGEPKAILALALDPPNLSDIERTILVLKEAGGLLLTCDGAFTPHDGDLTYLGLLMAQLPLDIRLTRLIALGYIFSILPECIVMAASMSLKSVFSNPFKEKMLAYNSKLEWADASCSDCIAFLNVFKVYKENIDEGFFLRSAGGGEEQWAKRHFIQIRQLKEVVNLVADITRRLKVNQIEEAPLPNRSTINYNEFEKALMLKLVIAGAFYPNYFGRGGRGGQVDEPSAVKTLGGRDPFTTIYFNGYPPEQPPHLYSELIKQELSDCKEDMRVTYDGSCKVYVEFRRTDYQRDSEMGYDDRVPGKISMAVYRAVKLRQIRRHVEIRIMRPEEARERAKKLGISKSRETYLRELRTDDPKDEMDDLESCASEASTVKSFASNLPGIDVSYIHIKIPHYIDAGHFWACHADHANQQYQNRIFEKLNAPDAKLRRFTKCPQVGDLCVALWSENAGDQECKYRARVESVSYKKKIEEVNVFFIDYGNTSRLPIEKLYDYTPDLYKEVASFSMQAFECVLSGLGPSMVRNKNGNWSKDANRYFIRATRNCDLYGRIFSVVNGVVSLELFKMDQNRKQISINECLIEEGFAEPVEESFLSKANHEIREQRQMDPATRTVYNNMQDAEIWSENKYEPPDRRDCKLNLQLRGPMSPLEMKVFSYARGALSKEVRVAQDSVNSVLLDTDPQDAHERLIVSAHVSQNQSNTALILHQSTIMPNIHGLAALIPFIFAPKIELRVNDTRTKYIGLICGLGVDQNGRPMFPEHDMEIPFDVEFSFEDLKNVNRLRYMMGQLLHTDENEKYPSLHWNDIVKLQKNIKKIVLELLCQRRKSQEIQFSKKQHMWGLAEANCYIQNKNIVESSKRSIFPFHPGIQIHAESEEVVHLRNHNEELNRIARDGIEKFTKIECQLCNVVLSTVAALRIHLNTSQHRDSEISLQDDD